MSETYIPSVVIVGRPNVGKSTLFNYIAKKQVAIVEETPGVTRDRVIRTVTWASRTFDLIDTGGIGIVDEEQLAKGIEKQIDIAIDVADIILYLVDIQTGTHTIEDEIAKRLHRLGKEVVLVANKADSPAKEEGAYHFLKFGFGDPLVISVKGRRGMAALEKRIAELIDTTDEPERPEERIPRLALIGRRNVGKSSLVNALLNEERVIVSSIPGTTRDSIDVLVKRGRQEYLLVDTAGLMRKSKRKGIDFYGSVRTERSINRADGIILMIDAIGGFGRVDKQVAEQVVRKYKPCVIVVNKWDLSGEVRTGQYTKFLAQELPGLHFAPVIYTSVHDRNHIWSPIEVMHTLLLESLTEIKTAKLNTIVQDAIKKRRPRVKGNRDPKIYYAVQTGVAPPSFRVFTNAARLFNQSYRRYLANTIRKQSGITEIPIKITFTSKVDESQIPRK